MARITPAKQFEIKKIRVVFNALEYKMKAVCVFSSVIGAAESNKRGFIKAFAGQKPKRTGIVNFPLVLVE